jgi:hypothetical protein
MRVSQVRKMNDGMQNPVVVSSPATDAKSPPSTYPAAVAPTANIHAVTSSQTVATAQANRRGAAL